MKILTATKLLALLFILLSATTMALVIKMNRSFERDHLSMSRQLQFHQLAKNLADASDFLTTEARQFTITGDMKHYDAYWKEVRDTRTRDKVVKRMEEIGATNKELLLLEKAKRNSDSLVYIEERAMSLAKNGDLERSQALMFDDDYKTSKSQIMKPIQLFITTMQSRIETEAYQSQKDAEAVLQLVNAVIILFIASVLSTMYFIVIRTVGRPLSHIVESMNLISSGQTLVEIPYTDNSNEIGDLAVAAKHFKNSLITNSQLADELKQNEENLEEQVKQRTSELSEANDELEEFAYRTSHDLRSPLISSIKLLTLAGESINTNNKEKANTCINHASQSLGKLNVLIEDILVLAKAKNEAEQNQQVHYSEIIDEALDKFDHMDNFNRIKIQKDYNFDSPLQVKKTRLTLVLENLISNAIKYCDTNKDNSYIKISTRQEANNFVIEISDNGIGIPDDQQGKLFTMFKRFHPSVSFGSGLGLYLIRKSVDVLNGKIAYEGLRDGSLFRLTIPLQ